MMKRKWTYWQDYTILDYVGDKVWANHEEVKRNQSRAFLDCIRLGKKFGYPKCCTMQFAKEYIEGKHPAQLRGLDNSGTFVPCDRCKELCQTNKQYAQSK